MADRCLRDWFCLFDVHLDEGHRPGWDQPQQSDFSTPDVMHAPFLRATIWILYITVPSHTINLPRVFMSLSIFKGYMGCKHSWCPSEISLLIILGRSNVQGEKALLRRGLHSLISSMPSPCVHPCVFVFLCQCGCCIQNGGLSTKTLCCCYWNTATFCFHTEEPLRETKTAKVRAEWFNNLSQRFGRFFVFFFRPQPPALPHHSAEIPQSPY